MTLKKKVLSDTPLSLPSNKGPVWKGPTIDGISQTLLGRYLTCAERFRVMAIEGLAPTPSFNNRLEFGNMWHAAEEAHAKGVDYTRPLLDYANALGVLYPTQLMQIVHWIKVIEALFPVYVDYWSKHQDTLNRTPLLQEERFAVPYILPSGRTVLLRGKWDSVDLVTSPPIKPGDVYYDHKGERLIYSKIAARGMKNMGGINDGIWLMENKTKSVIDVQKINRQLRFDLQSMLYLVALKEAQNTSEFTGTPPEAMAKRILTLMGDSPIKGVRYNVIKRSSHKTAESMVKKVGEDIRDGRAGEWFSRWNVEIDARDIQVFKDKALDPILDNLLDDYEWWRHCSQYDMKPSKTEMYDNTLRKKVFPHHQRRHFIMPYIGYNPLSEGGESELDGFIFSGNEIGLQRVETLFPELA